MSSISYYDKNSQDFHDRTINADVQDLYQKFLKHVPKQGRILDAGCGVGRDSKFFLSKGYEVLPFDGSLEMVKLTSNLLGKDALHMLFQDIHFSSEFDAVWVNASLLHVPYENLREVIEGFHKALLLSGILYASFKYGTSMRQTEDRIFFDMDEASIEPYLKGLFVPLEIWKSADTRSTVAPSPDKSWLNFIARRI
ncbi:MAG: class I SAM-dependent methyltransferase [Chlamydiae bacterium]|nr:class I SAM-dependent methyltransferase [Chlamydiota bacterium]